MYKIGSMVKVYFLDQSFIIGKIDIINYNSQIMFVLDDQGNSHIVEFNEVDVI